MDGHTGGHLAQFLEFRYPEIFIQVKIAVVALRRAGVGAEEVKARAVAERHWIAFQLYIHFFCKVDNVLLENVRLYLAG